MRRRNQKRSFGRYGAAVLLLVLTVAALGGRDRIYAAGENFQVENGRLVKYNGTDAKVSVPLTVTAIGPGAFSGNRSLKSVTLPPSIESIGMGAFENCGNLTSVSVPEGCASIGPSAFGGCGSLLRASVPASVERIGSGAFSDCDILSDVYIHSGNPRYLCVDGAIYDFKNNMLVQYLAGRAEGSYYMPDAIDKIESYAFWGADTLKYVHAAPYVEEIGSHAFAGCRGLEEVEFPDGLKKIGLGAFQDCVGLKRAALPSSVRQIDETAFDGCVNLTLETEPGSAGADYAVKFEEKKKEWKAGKKAGGGVPSAGAGSSPDGSDSSGTASSSGRSDSSGTASSQDGSDSPGAASSSNGSGSAGMASSPGRSDSSGTASSSDGSGSPGTASSQGGAGSAGGTAPADSGVGGAPEAKSAGGKASGGKTLGEAPLVDNSATVWMEGGEVFDGYQVEQEAQEPPEDPAGNAINSADGFLVIDGVLADYSGGQVLVRVPDNVRSVGSRVFYNEKNMRSAALPGDVEEIGDFAFTRSGLFSVNLPEGLKDIGYGAFYQCGSLKNVRIPDTVENIGLAAFGDTPWLNNWFQNGSEDFLVVGDGILLAYKGNRETVKIPSHVKQIGPGCFKGREEIKEVVLPQGVTKIGEDAFNGCASLYHIALPDSLLAVDDRAFNGCPLSEVFIPSNVESVGMRAFDRSGAATSQGESRVVFGGSKLPVLSYNDSADRLKNGSLRGSAFAGFDKAVTPQGVELSGTVLDGGDYGFSGMVLDETGKTLREGDRGSEGEEQSLSRSGGSAAIPMSLNHPAIRGADLAAASFDKPQEGDYEIRITGGADARLAVKKAIQSRKSEDASGGATGNTSVRYEAMDISLYPQGSPVSIKSLTGQKVMLKLPIPASMAGDAENVRVMSVGSNGEFEPVPARLAEEGETPCVQFKTSHFSAFAFYLEN